MGSLTMRSAVVGLSLCLAACQSGDQDTPPGAGEGAAVSETVAIVSDEPVPQGEPNKKDASPAFAGQTRAPAIDSGVELRVDVVADELDEPWAIALLPDDTLLVSERTGRLLHITLAGEVKEVGGIPDLYTRGQGGLLDVTPAQDFGASRLVYFTFSEPREGNSNGTSLARGRLSDDFSLLENVEVVFQQTPSWNSPLHFGSNIEWAPDGSLYLALGERSMPEPRQLAQDLGGHLGKVVRLQPDGAAAEGNPFVGRDDAQPEIWSYGHRNVQGAAIHPETGKLWTIEHGPRGGDELNIPAAGKNYGWPVITYGIDYPGGPIGEGITSQEGHEQPVYYWDPVIAPGDMTFYRGELFPWTGDLLIAGLAGYLVRLELDGESVVGEERVLSDLGRIRDVQEASDGSLWVITDEGDGVLARVRPAS